VPRADVWVFDAANLGAAFGGTPLEIVELFGDTPRALAVSNDGNTVYAAIFHSGNQTTAINEGLVCDGFAGAASGPCAGDGLTMPGGLPGGDMPAGNPGPATNHAGVAAPEVGLIVQFDPVSGEWRDEDDNNWNNAVRFSLPDHDVFAIDAASLNQTGQWNSVGTILFNMAVNPTNDKIYVSNGESKNLTRFEGPGTFFDSTVQGNLSQYRISVLSGASTVDTRHLNKHISYGTLPAPAGIKDHSLATPLDMVFDTTGTTVYVAAFGSNKVGVFQTATLENDTFNPLAQSSQYVPVSGGGPSHRCRQRDRHRAAPRPGARPHREGPAHALRRLQDLVERRGLVLELPHLRRLRQPGLGPGRPRRRRHDQSDGRHACGSRRRRRERRRGPGRVPPHEGPHDHPDAEGDGQQRRHALARRPHRRLLRTGQPLPDGWWQRRR
jgi:DNA-binding beta-propeller fold protein YncE